MLYLFYIYAFLFGIPLGFITVWYVRRIGKNGASLLTVLGINYATIIVGILCFTFTSGILTQTVLFSRIELFLASVLITIVTWMILLKKIFKLSVVHLSIIMCITGGVTILYIFGVSVMTRSILNIHYPVPAAFCKYGEVDVSGACLQDGLAHVGDGIFQRFSIVNDASDMDLKQGKLLLIHNSQREKEVVRIEAYTAGMSYLDAMRVNTDGSTSTTRIEKHDILGID